MRILVVDNNRDRAYWGAQALCRSLREARGTRPIEVQVRRGPESDLPPDVSEFDALVVSGSATSQFEKAPWINSLLALIRDCVARQKPYLGVCFGHQMLARAVMGEAVLAKSEQPEYGWAQIEQTAENPLFAGLPQKFVTYESHSEEVHNLGAQFTVFARSAMTSVQAMQLSGKPAWGIQFHPEKSLEEAERALAERKKAGGAQNLLRPREGHRLYQSEVGKTVFSNFLGQIR